jgi:tetratricopeptide (TPR) repeat protein
MEYLGEMHSTTIGVRRTLVDAYIGNGQLALAMQSCSQVLRTQERLANETDLDPSLIQDTCMYGILCYRLKDLQAAKQYYEKVLHYIKLDRRMAKYAIIEIDRIASSLAKTGDYRAAVDILEALLPEAKSVVEGDTRDIALVMGNLATVYHHQSRFAEAEKLERQVVEIRRNILGRFHADTITGLANLRISLIEQGRFKDAAGIGEEELHAYAGSRNATPVMIANATAIVADSLEEHEEYQLALHVTEIGRQLTEADSDDAHSICLRILARSARYSLHLGDISQAEETTTVLLHKVTTLSGLNIDGLLSQLIPLANKYLEMECFTASEQTIVLSCLLSRGDLDLPEKLRVELSSLMTRYLRARGLDHFDARFDPDALSSCTCTKS